MYIEDPESYVGFEKVITAFNKNLDLPEKAFRKSMAHPEVFNAVMKLDFSASKEEFFDVLQPVYKRVLLHQEPEGFPTPSFLKLYHITQDDIERMRFLNGI